MFLTLNYKKSISFAVLQSENIKAHLKFIENMSKVLQSFSFAVWKMVAILWRESNKAD